MLPAVIRTATHTAIPAVAATALLAATLTPAQALGKNERNVLKGIAAAAIIGGLIHQGRANAQPAPAPIPLTAAPAPTSNVAAMAFYEFDPQARRLIQRRLAAYGYYRGAIDGIWGRQTATAINRYARDVDAAPYLQSRDGVVALFNGLIG